MKQETLDAATAWQLEAREYYAKAALYVEHGNAAGSPKERKAWYEAAIEAQGRAWYRSYRARLALGLIAYAEAFDPPRPMAYHFDQSKLRDPWDSGTSEDRKYFDWDPE